MIAIYGRGPSINLFPSVKILRIFMTGAYAPCMSMPLTFGTKLFTENCDFNFRNESVLYCTELAKSTNPEHKKTRI